MKLSDSGQVLGSFENNLKMTLDTLGRVVVDFIFLKKISDKSEAAPDWAYYKLDILISSLSCSYIRVCVRVKIRLKVRVLDYSFDSKVNTHVVCPFL